jgi:hypothetical protein
MTDTFHPQGSDAWRRARCGKITASNFSAIVTPEGKPRTGKTPETELMTIGGEIVSGVPRPEARSKAIDWGHEHEPHAAEVYGHVTGHECTEVGFIRHPVDPLIGGSPDRLIGTDGGVEIKCPLNTANHLRYLLGGELPPEHRAQVYGLMWLTAAEWWAFASYDPRIPDVKLALFVHRVDRDDRFIAKLESGVLAFAERLRATLKRLGVET